MTMPIFKYENQNMLCLQILRNMLWNIFLAEFRMNISKHLHCHAFSTEWLLSWYGCGNKALGCSGEDLTLQDSILCDLMVE